MVNFELHDQARSYLFTIYSQQRDHARLYIIFVPNSQKIMQETRINSFMILNKDLA